MLFTDFRQYGERGDRSKIVLTILGAIFKERCDARHFPFSWRTATQVESRVRHIWFQSEGLREAPYSPR